MKIGIRTVFKTENCGSVLQAWALKTQLSNLGSNVVFCDYDASQSNSKIVSVIKCTLKGKLKRAYFILKKTSDYKKFRKKNGLVGYKGTCDAYVFGSDTLWNFDDRWFCDKRNFFTGEGIEAPCYAYAVSVGSTSCEKVKNISDSVNNICKFKGVAVRDSHTMDVISSFYPKEKITATLDPTLLIKKDEYARIASVDSFKYKNGLVVYYFGEIPDELWIKIKSFARSHGLLTINIGMPNKLADISLVPSPENFISAFSTAKYIFTNTFHGCVFSTIFNKQFATNGAHKKKIQGFLSEFSLTDQIVSDENNVDVVFSSPINYNHVNELIDGARKRSLDYLEQVLSGADNYE